MSPPLGYGALSDDVWRLTSGQSTPRAPARDLSQTRGFPATSNSNPAMFPYCTDANPRKSRRGTPAGVPSNPNLCRPVSTECSCENYRSIRRPQTYAKAAVDSIKFLQLSLFWTGHHSVASCVSDRSIAAAGSRLWNTLPDDITSEPTLLVSRRKLKTHLFRQSYPDIIL